jgi:hypothetical protein
MKKILLFIFPLFFQLTTSAQLANTRWVGTIKGDNPRKVYFNFNEGGFSVYTVSDSSLVEMMVYTTENNQLTVKKVDGQSDCDNGSTAKYSFKATKDSLFIKKIEDVCDDRSSAVDGFAGVKWKKHPEVKVDTSILKQYVGVYALDAHREVIISEENGKLQIEGPKIGLPKLALIAVSNSRFFLKIAYVEMDFIRDATGKVTKMISHEEKDYELKKMN